MNLHLMATTCILSAQTSNNCDIRDDIDQPRASSHSCVCLLVSEQQMAQARAQFEHYQEATAQQRAEERQQYEQARKLIDAELAETQGQLASRDRALSAQAHQIGELQHGAQRVADELSETSDTLARLKRECAAHQQQLGIALAFVAQLELRLEAANTALSVATSETAVLHSEQRHLVERSVGLEAKIASLEAAAHTLYIEKALLTAQLPPSVT